MPGATWRAKQGVKTVCRWSNVLQGVVLFISVLMNNVLRNEARYIPLYLQSIHRGGRPNSHFNPPAGVRFLER